MRRFICPRHFTLILWTFSSVASAVAAPTFRASTGECDCDGALGGVPVSVLSQRPAPQPVTDAPPADEAQPAYASGLQMAGERGPCLLRGWFGLAGAAAGHLPNRDFSRTAAEGDVARALPPPPSSVTLGLTALAALGALHAGRSIRKIHVGHVPEWYHEWASPVGHVRVLEVDAAGRVVRPLDLAPAYASICDAHAAEESPRLDRCLPFHRAGAGRCASELVLLLTAARPPPVIRAQLA